MKKTLSINGIEIECKKFATRKAAQNFIDRDENREIVFFKSREYYVSI